MWRRREKEEVLQSVFADGSSEWDIEWPDAGDGKPMPAVAGRWITLPSDADWAEIMIFASLLFLLGLFASVGFGSLGILEPPLGSYLQATLLFLPALGFLARNLAKLRRRVKGALLRFDVGVGREQAHKILLGACNSAGLRVLRTRQVLTKWHVQLHPPLRLTYEMLPYVWGAVRVEVEGSAHLRQMARLKGAILEAMVEQGVRSAPRGGERMLEVRTLTGWMRAGRTR